MTALRTRAAQTLLLAVLVAAVYGRTLGHGFAFDDRMLVVENPMIEATPLDALSRLGGGASYRPIRVVSYQLDRLAAGGLSPWAFHLSNLLWHLATCLVLLSLARAMTGSDLGGLAAAAWFAVHPLGTEAVAYVSGRRDLLVTFFGLAALRAWWALLDRRDEAKAWGWVTAGLVLIFAITTALAVGSKETGLAVPAGAALLSLAHRWRARAGRPVDGSATPGTQGRSSGPGARAVGSIGPAVAFAIAAGAALLLYPDRVAPLWERVSEPPLAPQPALTLEVLGRYLWLAVWPVQLSADYRVGAFLLPGSPWTLSGLLGLATISVVVGGGFWLAWRGRPEGMGLVWYVLCLLPVAQIVPYREVLAEHNAYLGLPGLALAVGGAATEMWRGWPRAALAAAAVLLVAYSARTLVRVGDWRDDLTLWEATLRVAPGSVRARHNLGVSQVEAGRLAEGRVTLEQTLRAAPEERDAVLALAGVYVRLGDLGRARELARRALDTGRDARVLELLGWIDLGAGDPESAGRLFEEALGLEGSPEAQRGLGLARRQRR